MRSRALGWRRPRSSPPCSASTSPASSSGRPASMSCASGSRRTRNSPPRSEMASRYTPTRDELAELLDGEPRYRVDQVWQGLYTQLAEPEEMTNLPKALRARLATELPTSLTTVVRRVSDGGDTVK